MKKYAIRKHHTGNWGIYQTEYEDGIHFVEYITARPTWEEAMFDVRFLINADRAFSRMKEEERKPRIRF